MCERFLKLNLDNDDALYLAKKHPNAFILITFIAERARRENGHPDGLTAGQCHIGDWENMGLTRQEYRTALSHLIAKKYLEKVETCRTRQKSTNRTTTIGTLVKLCDTRIYDINSEHNNHRINHRATTEQPPSNHEQEGKRISSNEDIEIAQPAKRLRLRHDGLSFDFEKWEYVGISDKDISEWKVVYPHIDLRIEITKSISWLKSNPSKSGKTLWRKFLLGWLSRANDNVENKKAFRAASGVQDRRTKDMSGAPVESPHTGKF